jgi:cytochrome c peroxidase
MKREIFQGMMLALATLCVYGAVVAGAQLTPEEQLGKLLFFHKIASPDTVACASCHAPETGFTGPNPGINAHGAVYPGAVPNGSATASPRAAPTPRSAPSLTMTIVRSSLSEAISGMAGQPAKSWATPPPTRHWARF